jgi:putative ATP-dependent endonuclease of OLD family
MQAQFIGLIGPGDSCKTTILTALDYALSPRTALAFDDSDFFGQDVDQDIVIQVTLSDWDEGVPDVKQLFQESKFAQYKCGLTTTGPVAEPLPDGTAALSVSLRVDKSLEPKWFVVKGRDEVGDEDRKPIYATDRAVLGLSCLEMASDAHFAWGRNTLLTRLSADNKGNLNAVLAALSREMRLTDISGHPSIAECQSIADTIKTEAQGAGVSLTALSPRIDVQRQSMTGGAMSLHDGNIPLRGKGAGTKRLVATAMQMKLHGGKNISVIDEIEVGLEPHRIRGLLFKLKKSRQQVFATTHSPVVLRELTVDANELHICKRDAAGVVTVQDLNVVAGIQGSVRANAEAFLGSKIIACEGPTEIGCLRAYDIFRFDKDNPPVWSLSTSYFNAGGGSKIKAACPKLRALGYGVAAFADNDAKDQLNAGDVEALRAGGITVCQWEEGNSTEHQLFADIPWKNVPELLKRICSQHDTLTLATVIDVIIKDSRVATFNLGQGSAGWPESPILRKVIGDLVHEGKWIKRIDYAEKAFEFALPLLADTTTIKVQLAALWNWMQRSE